ncbi:DgyrCDS3762 [Dimorphilus gyrociliatus]|uniref:Cytosine-specific methyltransferase n=1 Tax=Dimorphilus gyrociliatus TaxID=2664684 RepID=A0A7I8VJH8_9ANNE|nr:DgyrCDS3762 [Dimorphilus gyrociliatus]
MLKSRKKRTITNQSNNANKVRKENDHLTFSNILIFKKSEKSWEEIIIDEKYSTSYDYVPQVHITNFVIYDEENHIVSIDSGILTRNHQLKLDGYAKPIYNLDTTLTGGNYVKEVSGISSWFITGFTEEDNIRIGLVRCDDGDEIWLSEPAEIYQPFYRPLLQKSTIFKGIITFATTRIDEDPSYEDLTIYLSEQTLPDNQIFSTDFLVSNVKWMWEQIVSYDSARDENEESILHMRCLRYIMKLTGVKLNKKLGSTTRIRRKEKELRETKPKKPILTKATVTPLVKYIFEEVFQGQLASGKTNDNEVEENAEDADEEDCEGDDDVTIKNTDIKILQELRSSSRNSSLSSTSSSLLVKNEKDNSVRWFNDPIFQYSGINYYESCEYNDMWLRVGDCIRYKATDKILLFRIIHLTENKYKSQKWHGHFFLKSCETLLGEYGEQQELFLVEECFESTFKNIIEKIEVNFLDSEQQWQNRKFTTKVDSKVDTKDRNSYYCSKMYNSSAAMFSDIPAIYKEIDMYSLAASHKKSCNLNQSNKDTVSIEKDGKEILSVSFKNITYEVNDCVYIENDAYTFKAFQPEKKEKAPEEDKTLDRPERYRHLRDRNPVVLAQPVLIGHIRKICRISSKLSDKSFGFVINKLYRPENTNLGNNSIYSGYLHRLYYSNESAQVTLSQVKGKCFVITEEYAEKFYQDCDEPLGRYFDQGPDRFYIAAMYCHKRNIFKDLPSDIKKHFETKTIHELKPVKKLVTLDVFAGCGGLSEGLHQSGISEAKWAIEFNTDAANSYQKRFPNAKVYNLDCNQLLDEALEAYEKGTDTPYPKPGEVELLCGGPPCQGFSGMNRFNKRDYSKFKNSLIASFYSYCDFYRPKYIIMENVRTFFVHKKSEVFRLTVTALLKMGYQCRFGILQAGCYGIPQSRRRAFIIGAAPGHKLPNFPEPTHAFSFSGLNLSAGNMKFGICFKNLYAPLRTITVRDAIMDLPKIENNQRDLHTELEYKGLPDSHYQRLLRKDTGDTVFDHICKPLNVLVIERIKHVPKSPKSDWRDIPNIEITLQDGRIIKKLVYEYDDIQNGRGPNGELRGVCKCATVKGKIEGLKCQDLNQQDTLIPWCLPHTGNRHNDWTGLYGRLDWNGHFITTVTNPDPMAKQGRVVHPNQDRVVSVRENARSQGFPDSFTFCGIIPERYRQIGNAVPPPLSKAIGGEFKKILMDQK